MNTKPYHLNNAGLLQENDRSLYERVRDNGEVCYDSTSRSKIDFSRTNLNYNLCPHEQYTKEELISIHENIRGKKFPQNGVLFGSTIITIPKDYEGDQRAFFSNAYEGLKNLYGLADEDIVSAFVHLDETSPHMHFNFIPHHGDKISWEKTMPKRIFDTQHRLLEDYLNKQDIGEVHLLNGQTLGFDVQSLTPEQKEISMEIYQLKEQRDEIYQNILGLESKKTKLESDINYYFSQGRVDDAEKSTMEWEKCNQELSILAAQKKEIGIDLDDKFKMLSENTRPTAVQKQIFELIADNVHLTANQQALESEIALLRAESEENQAEIRSQTHTIAQNSKKIAESEEKIEDLTAKSDQIKQIQRDTIAEIQKMGKEAEEKEALVKQRVAKAEKALSLAENQAKIIIDNAQNQADVLVDNAREHAVDIYLDKTRAYHEEELKALKSIVANPDDRNALQRMADYMRDKANKFGVTLMTSLQDFERSIVTKLRITDAIYATQAEGISMYVGKGGLTSKQMDYLSKQFDTMLKDNDPEHDWMRECYANQYGGDDFKRLWVSMVKSYCEAHPAQRINSAIPQINKTEQAMVKMSAGVANYLVSSIQRSADDYERER